MADKKTYVTFYAGFVNDLINGVCGNPWFQSRCRNIQHLSSKSTHLPHAILSLLIQNLNLRSPSKGLFAIWGPICGIIWVGYRFRDFALFRQRIYWSQRAGIRECWKGIVMTGVWIGFRDNLWSYEIAKKITLRFVKGFMCRLWSVSPTC
jgi:hypothetical protein